MHLEKITINCLVTAKLNKTWQSGYGTLYMYMMQKPHENNCQKKQSNCKCSTVVGCLPVSTTYSMITAAP